MAYAAYQSVGMCSALTISSSVLTGPAALENSVDSEKMKRVWAVREKSQRLKLFVDCCAYVLSSHQTQRKDAEAPEALIPRPRSLARSACVSYLATAWSQGVTLSCATWGMGLASSQLMQQVRPIMPLTPLQETLAALTS